MADEETTPERRPFPPLPGFDKPPLLPPSRPEHLHIHLKADGTKIAEAMTPYLPASNPVPKLSTAAMEKARICIRAAVMHDHEGESYTAIARMLGLRDADHARRAADVARSMIEAGDGGNT